MRFELGFVCLLSIGCSNGSFQVADPGADGSASDSASFDSANDLGMVDDVPVTPGPDAIMIDGGGGGGSDSAPDSTATCVAPEYPKAARACTNDESCSFGLHQIDCCGSQIAIGFNHSYTDAFNAAEAAYRKACPSCGCATKPTVTEDGKSTGTIAVKCQGSPGTCRTFMK